MTNQWFLDVKKRLDEELQHPTGIAIERLQAQGMINDLGEVTGHLHRWTAYLAITALKRVTGQPQIDLFRCMMPVFGMPNGTPIDVPRTSLVAYLKARKKIITARRDDRLDLWKEGCDVHLSALGFVRCDSADAAEDNVGILPEFQQSTSRL